MPRSINPDNIPSHVAIIMDGNGRWAQAKGENRLFGHSNGVESVRETIKCARELEVSYLTLYAFSTENWSRPKEEIDGLMQLLVASIHSELALLMENNVRLATIGNLSLLPEDCRISLDEAVQKTAKNKDITLILALNYSSRDELMRAFNRMATDVLNGKLIPGKIGQKDLEKELDTASFPDPELLIRTSGEHRVSNFLLWQLAYAEMHFTNVYWPEFRRQHFMDAIIDFQSRERRFGKISEQVR
ncbi:MAG TPA: isoprenyl transferase [Crocinitomicaceae bacterium]|nr:isoprenyl transferase [Crocinitomicaceae bacterium]